MEKLLKEFEVEPKNPSEEALRRWRRAVWLVKNPRRRFRMVADIAKRAEVERRKRSIQEKIRIALYVKKAALQFVKAGATGAAADSKAEISLSDEVKREGFGINPDEVAGLAREHNIDGLTENEGVSGIARRVSVSTSEGIHSSEISVRQKIYGSNRYTERPPKSFLMFVWEALHDLTLIVLIICAILSIGIGLPTEGWPRGTYDGVGIILSVFFVVLITATSDFKQSLQFRDLDREKKKILVHVTRDGRKQQASIFDLVVGDVVHLSIGDIVPADGIYISGYALVVDESSLSGESDPVIINEEKPFLLAGTKVQDGSAKMLVTAVGMRTEWGKLMESLGEGGEEETPLQVKLNGVATVIGKIGVGFALLTFLVLTVRFLLEKSHHGGLSSWSSGDILHLLNFFAIAVTIIVVAVPEGLPLAVTLSLAFAMKKLMNCKALVRHLSACETMGSATCICTDKTGTLTTNHMVIDKIWLCGEVKDVRNRGEEMETVSGMGLTLLWQIIFRNTNCDMSKDDNGKDKILGTPTDKALFEFGLQFGGDANAQCRNLEILEVEPFNSERKKMSVLVSLPEGGTRAFCKGASEMVLKMCDRLVDGSGESVPLSEEQRTAILDVINEFASEALRTLCLAFKDTDGAVGIPDAGYTLIAVVGIKDPVRPGVKDAVQTCLDAGITIRMVTGDNINTARAIAKECGILTEGGMAVEGPEFRKMSSQQMTSIVPKIKVMARSLPLDKHTLVTSLRKSFNEVVAVTGDGTNDAPALHEADIGLAMGLAGTEVAKENADVIIMDDNFMTIVNVVKWGRAVYINIQKFVQFQLTVNIVALVINFVSACISGSAPLTAVQLLWVNMIMDTLGALALATEPPNDGLMKRPPVKRGESFITKSMWRNIFGQSVYQLIVLATLNFGGAHLLGIHGLLPNSNLINTLIFNTFVFCQIFNEINSREIERINVFRGMFNNWIFLSVVASTVIFQVIIVEYLGALANTVPLGWQLWLLSVSLGAVSMAVSVFLKLIPVCTMPCKHHDGYDALPAGPELA